MALSAYETLTNEPLAFPIGGKTYTLAPLSIPAGLKLAGVVSGEDTEFLESKTEELWKLILGPLWDEMITDGVPLAAAIRVALTAYAEHTEGRATALIAWETGGDPKALEKYLSPEPNRASRRSPSTAKATTTKPRVVSSGTSSRKK